MEKCEVILKVKNIPTQKEFLQAQCILQHKPCLYFLYKMFFVLQLLLIYVIKWLTNKFQYNCKYQNVSIAL